MKNWVRLKEKGVREVLSSLLWVSCCAASAFGAVLPPELSDLEALNGDEAALVEAARERFIAQKAVFDTALNPSSNLSAEAVDKARGDLHDEMELAEAMWKYVLAYYPNNARANTYYGEFLYDYTTRKSEGVLLWRKATAQDKNFGNAYNNLGIHYFHTGQIKLGNKYLEKALKIDPKNPDFNFNMAQMYLNHYPQLGKLLKMSKKKVYREAMKYSQKAVKYAPDDFELLQDYAVNFFAADNFELKVDWKKSAEAWAAARVQAPSEQDKFFTHLNEGRSWLRAKNYRKAIESLEAALEIHPDSRVALQLRDRANERL